MKICSLTYDIVDTLPEMERFGLRSQITRSAVSIPSNIAEGCSRSKNDDFARLLEISLGSCYELKTQILIAQIKYLNNKLGLEELYNYISQEQKMISAFYQRAKKIKANTLTPLPKS